jgi:N-acetylmuramoyl-L-alanine amidase
MRKLWFILYCIGYVLFGQSVYAGPAQVSGLRFWTDPENTRLVFDISERPQYRVSVARNPCRLIIDLRNAKLSRQLLQPPESHPLLAGLQGSVLTNGDLRIVVALKNAAIPNSFALAPNKIYGNRLVVDLSRGNHSLEAKTVIADVEKPLRPVGKKPSSVTVKASSSTSKHAESADKLRAVALSGGKKNSSPVLSAVDSLSRSKDIIVAIDAGHGGEDPGARGLSGIEEKAVVFAIAKKLEKLVKNYPGIRPIMVRNGDYYVGLRKRMDIARAAKADLFISIHADAYKDNSVKGASVFTLSQRGASSEAAHWLADSENGADLVGGVSLEDKNNILASVLLDLSQTATQEASQKVAKRVLRNFSKIGALHHEVVQKAGFAVLKSPDIPSILVETAFISNPADEQNLRNESYQNKVARAIFNGILDYFQQNPPPGTVMASSDSGREG